MAAAPATTTTTTMTTTTTTTTTTPTETTLTSPAPSTVSATTPSSSSYSAVREMLRDTQLATTGNDATTTPSEDADGDDSVGGEGGAVSHAHGHLLKMFEKNKKGGPATPKASSTNARFAPGAAARPVASPLQPRRAETESLQTPPTQPILAPLTPPNPIAGEPPIFPVNLKKTGVK